MKSMYNPMFYACPLPFWQIRHLCTILWTFYLITANDIAYPQVPWFYLDQYSRPVLLIQHADNLLLSNFKAQIFY